MKKIAIALLLAVVCARSAAAVLFPVNEDRKRGDVTSLYTSSSGGASWVAFVMTLADGTAVRFDCGTRAKDLGCDLVALGDHLLVTGHTEGYAGSCRWDGVDYLLVPDTIYHCESATLCSQLK